MGTSTETYDEFPGPVTAIDDARMTVAAAFPDREHAHATARALHAEGFRDRWIGIARADEGGYGYADMAQQDEQQADPQTRIESDNWFIRFFGEGDESLADALVRRGVSDADARAAGTLEPHAALLTVDGTNHPELAAHIIVQHGGRLITRGFGATGYGTSGAYGAGVTGARRTGQRLLDTDAAILTDAASVPESAIAAKPPSEEDFSPCALPPGSGADSQNAGRPIGTAMTPATGGTADVVADDAIALDDESTSAAGRDDYGRYRAGTPIDESTRLQLRQERLRVDKSRVARSAATVSTDIASDSYAFDVPVTREELFVERRRVRSAAPASDVSNR